MYEVLLVIYLVFAMILIGLILLQQGKGSEMGASFGAGASATLFGSSGSATFLTRATAVFATLFFFISLVLGNMTSHKKYQTSQWTDLSESSRGEAIVSDLRDVEKNDISTTEGTLHGK